jgi:hypothetical protein
MKSNVIFVMFHTRLQSVDFVVVLVVVLVLVPFIALISRTSTSTKRIRLNRMHLRLAPSALYETT